VLLLLQHYFPEDIVISIMDQCQTEAADNILLHTQL
jgi:hypothetical protein